MDNIEIFSKRMSPFGIHGWVTGRTDDYEFEAKLSNEPSRFGIRDGRVIKLILKDSGGEVANYDRGWEYKPDSPEFENFLTTLLDALEPLPPCEEWQHPENVGRNALRKGACDEDNL